MGFLSSDKLIVGYDLGNKNSQISYAVSESGEVETLSVVAGAQNFNIPTVLCKRYGVNQWFYGKEALRYAEEGQGILVENLLELAVDGETVVIEGESYNPVALLALFFKRSMGVLSRVGAPDKITALMITCPAMDRRVMEVLGQVVDGIHLKSDRVFFQSHTESFYNYMIHQPKELWTYQAVMFHYWENGIKAYRMECNRHTTPIVVFIEEKEYSFEEYTLLGQQNDTAFLKIAEETCAGNQVAGVFLIGDGFTGDWMKESLKYLCRGRRVFQGNNLFSKGACYGMQELLEKSAVGNEYVFLGKDKLKANVGMKLLRGGEPSYQALLDAGGNWYETETVTQIYCQEGNEISLAITPLIGKKSKEVSITLEDLPGSISRLQLTLFMETETSLVVEVMDLGFGEFRAPSGKVWRETIEIY